MESVKPMRYQIDLENLTATIRLAANGDILAVESVQMNTGKADGKGIWMKVRYYAKSGQVMPIMIIAADTVPYNRVIE